MRQGRVCDSLSYQRSENTDKEGRSCISLQRRGPRATPLLSPSSSSSSSSFQTLNIVSSSLAGESITVGGRGMSFAAQFPAGGLFAIDLSLSPSPNDIVVVVVCGAFVSLESPSSSLLLKSKSLLRTRLLTKHKQHNSSPVWIRRPF